MSTGATSRRTGRWSATAELGWRSYDIGAETVPVVAGTLPACGVACVNADYHIPLGYQAPRVRLRGTWAATPALSLGLNALLEHRGYIEQSYLSGVLVSPALRARSSKLRLDDVYQLAARARR